MTAGRSVAFHAGRFGIMVCGGPSSLSDNLPGSSAGPCRHVLCASGAWTAEETRADFIVVMCVVDETAEGGKTAAKPCQQQQLALSFMLYSYTCAL